jgi:C-methyltransferase
MFNVAVEKMWLPPVWLARTVERVRSGLLHLHRRSTLAPVALLELAMGAWLSQGLYVAAKLGVADVLARGLRSAAELARELETDERAMARLLRALSQYGVFLQRRDGRFAQTALSACLCADVPGSLRGFLLFLGHPNRGHWSQLDQTVCAGQSDIEDRYGTTLFEHMCQDRELGAVFEGAMTSLSQLANQATLVSYDFSSCHTVVDVGGGHGAHLASILQAAPRARGVLFDLPEVTAGSVGLLAHLGVQDRVRIESGSFFERVPKGGDAYVLKHIVHDWSDERAN